MKKLLFVLVLLCAFCVPQAHAQTSITTTTLSAAVTTGNVGNFTITVNSATGMAANGVLFIDGSVYRIVSVSGTTITVSNVFRPATHLTSALVYVVPLGAQIGQNPVGSCIRGTTGTFPQYSPYTYMFNLSEGTVAVCRGASGSRTWSVTAPYAVVISAAPPATP